MTSPIPTDTPPAGKTGGGSDARVRAGGVIAAILGVFVATGIVAYFNAGAVLKAIEPIGLPGFAAVIAAQLVLFVPLGVAWWVVAPRASGHPLVLIWARLMREAASDVLPFSQVGGIVISVRTAVLGGVTTPTAFGSAVIDITVEVVAQLLYTVVGIMLFIDHLGFGPAHQRLLVSLIAGLVIAAGLVGGFIATQRRGINLAERAITRILPTAAQHTIAVSEVVDGAYARPGRLWACLALHLAAWFGGAVGAWLILLLIGHRLPFLSVVAIESLLFAIRNAAFMIPGGLGVQEGAYALIGPLFGLPAEVALALSLLKRGRDLTVGIPALLSWQFVESRRRLRFK